MARNRHAVIWTRLGGEPRKMGDLVLGEREIAFTYTDDYLATGLAGFCLLGDGRLWGDETVTYPVSERIPVFPRLLALLPGRNPRNLQRRHYLDILRARLGHEPPPGIDTEWELLLLGGHGGIGHVDVFADDLAAHAWYAHPVSEQAPVTAGRSALWRMLAREVLDENVNFDPQLVEQVLGPTPSVGGMIPKLLVSLDTRADRMTLYPPETPGMTDVVLKIEPPEYRGLLDLEALCLDVHREAGFEVPRHWRFAHDELVFLAVQRFDREADGVVPMESLFSVIATGDHGFRETTDLLLDELGRVIRRLGEVARLAGDTAEQLYRRLLLALLTGNGDLHLDNLSLLGGIEDCRLSPVYDPAPMRAWPRHDLVSAIPFDAAACGDHAACFVALGRRFGLTAAQVRASIDAALSATVDYAERVMALERVPLARRERLCGIARRERAMLARHKG